jgi:internalin A
MRTSSVFFRAFAIAAFLCCAGPARAQTLVSFPDPNLEAAVCNALGLPTGPVTTNDLQSLDYLNLANDGITNLTGLEWATSLNDLTLSGNPVTNLSPLLGLPQLQALDMAYCNLRDLSPLCGLTNVTNLTLDGNPAPNLPQLACLPNLVSLSAAYCSLSNLTGINALVRLQSVSLGDNGLRDPAPLAALTNLTTLDLQGNLLGGTAGLAGLSNLANLTLTGCSLSSLSGLHGLTNLHYLYLGQNAVHDLSPLAGLTNLAALTLDSNPVATLAPLAALPWLAVLSLGNCSLTNLPSVQSLAAVRSLYVANNGIRDLTPLAGLTNLTTLDLTGNAPTNLTVLDDLAALNTLDLAACSITNISSLAALTHLQSLNLDYDSITNISPLLSLTNLYALGLGANRLTDISGLDKLSALAGVDLTRNLLDISPGAPSMSIITNLQNQGAWVGYVPQNQPPSFYNLCTNWVIRPNTPDDLGFAVEDDVTHADKVMVTVACSSAGPLSNSIINLVRTSFSIPPLLTPAIPLSPVILPPLHPPSTALQDAALGPVSAIPAWGGGVSYWDLTLTPTLNQTGTMTLTLTATDDTGLSTNVTILVTVAAPQSLDGACLDATNLVWQTGGNAPWFAQTNVSLTGSSAAQSGPVGANEESWLETTVAGPGILTFWWKTTATSISSYAVFTTSKGGALILAGGSDWRQAMVSIPAGQCALDWRFRTQFGSSPSAACWLDQVNFVPTMPDFWVEVAPGTSAAGATLTLHGEPDGMYELQVSTNLSCWSALSQVVLNSVNGAFTASVNDASAQVSPRFYRARQLPASAIWFGPLTFDASGSPVLQLHSQPGAACQILASTDLLTWSPLATVTNTTGTVGFTDTQTDTARRF